MEFAIIFVYIVVGIAEVSCLFVLSLCLYILFGWGKSIYHDKAQIHQPDYNRPVLKDSVGEVAFCKHCGKVICITSGTMWSIAPEKHSDNPPHVDWEEVK